MAGISFSVVEIATATPRMLMNLSNLVAIAIVALIPFSLEAVPVDPPVRVQGVAALTRVMRAAVPELRESGIEVQIGQDCGNSQAIAAVGTGEIDVALLGRILTAEDRASYPDREFEQQEIGAQAVVLLVSRLVWESGVHALKRAQVAALYSGHVESWKELGGLDRAPKFFEPAHGNGIWEMFASWLFGDLRKAPAVPWDVVKNGADAQSSVEFHSGAITVASARWADQRTAFPLALIDDSGTAIEPTIANITSGKYPLARPAFLAVSERPTGNKRKLLEFFRSEKGHAVVTANDLLPITALQKP